MSIYPVRIKSWFMDPKSVFYADLPKLIALLKHDDIRCNTCGSKVDVEDGFVSHGILHGYTEDNYCSEECMYCTI